MVQEGNTWKEFIRAVAGEAKGLIYDRASSWRQWGHWRGQGAGLGLTIGYRKDVKEKRGQTVRDREGEGKKQASAFAFQMNLWSCSHLRRRTPVSS